MLDDTTARCADLARMHLCVGGWRVWCAWIRVCWVNDLYASRHWTASEATDARCADRISWECKSVFRRCATSAGSRSTLESRMRGFVSVWRDQYNNPTLSCGYLESGDLRDMQS